MATVTKTGGKEEKWIPGHFEAVDVPVAVTLTLTLEEAGILRVLTDATLGTGPGRKEADQVWHALSSVGVPRYGKLDPASQTVRLAV